ncbi:SWIM zinc finger family protein [Streptomyces nodosus]|uniref:SWIM zinc finger family protein n=1 Tax=Streptomyces nodosus TaxID=40318 RepID=UPI0038263DB8
MSGAGEERPGASGAPRPADGARRALWAAREREPSDGGPPGDANAVEPGEAGTGGGVGPGVRPGDAARAALRRAAAERRGGIPGPGSMADEGALPEPAPAPPAVAAPPAVTTEPAPASEAPRTAASASASERAAASAAPRTTPAVRPGDAARQALRAARAQAAKEEAAEQASREQASREEASRAEAAQGREETGTAAQAGTAGAADTVRASHAVEAGGAARAVGAVGRPGASGARGRPDRGARASRPRARAHEAGAPVQGIGELLAGVFGPPESVAARAGTAFPERIAGAERTDAPPPTGHHASEPWSGQAHPDPPRSPRGTPEAAPAPARYPSSMAAPGRDGELRRTFAALPARPAGESERFAGTWWGNAWVDALEEGALDAARLARGRVYAERGKVDAITVTPGLVLAYVQGSRPRPYRVQVRLRTFSDEEWDGFLDAAAEQPGHIAALLDGQMPRSLAECGVRLLPAPGDLEPRCGCPDTGHPCKHAAAVCYQTARLLDRDPFVLLLLRGRGERPLLEALSRRNAARAARAARERKPAPLPGVRARDAMARQELPPLPAPLPPPAHPEQPPVYPGAPGGPDAFALDQLATDAAARAHVLLTTGQDPVADLTPWQDAVRLAAARPGSGLTAGTRELYASLAAATGRSTADLARAVAAWRQGGRTALAVLEEPWDPPAGRFDRARPLLLAADLPAFRPWRNHLTHPGGHLQLRLGRNGLWYAYESEPAREDWWPRGTPDPDPVGALTGLGALDGP